MKLIFLIGFGYFCFNQVILTTTGKIENENIPEEIFKSIDFPTYEHTEHKTQLMDLDNDCLFLVLNQLNLNSLLSLEDVHSEFNSLVSEIVKRIFRNKKLHIDMVKHYSLRIGINDCDIQMTSFSIAERILKNFGHLIKNLSIYRSNQERDNDIRLIYKLVNMYCSKTLSEIYLDNSVNNFLDEFTNQFENVQNVHIRNILETDRRLNEIFPSVRRLDIMLFNISNVDSINVRYENLEHLKLSISVNPSPLTDNLATELIRKNSHIRSLALENISIELIKIAADSLPQLERLKLDSIPCKHSNQLISFPNVRILETSKPDLHYLFLNFKFGNVEEIRTTSLVESMFWENGFFATNPNLKKLQVVSTGCSKYLMNMVIRQLANANTTLQDIFYEGAYGLDSSIILQLIVKSKQLKRLQINLGSPEDRNSISEYFRKIISDIWSIDDLGYSTIILEKVKINE